MSETEDPYEGCNLYLVQIVGLALFLTAFFRHFASGLWFRIDVWVASKLLPITVLENILDEIAVALVKITAAPAKHLPYEQRFIRAQRMTYEANAYIDELLYDDKQMDNPIKELNRQWRESYKGG